MKTYLSIDYNTSWGYDLYVCGSISTLGNWSEDKALKMCYSSNSIWTANFEIEESILSLEYYYIVKKGDKTIRKEWGKPHKLILQTNKTLKVKDIWQDKPSQEFLYTSAFYDSFFYHKSSNPIKYKDNHILLQVTCPYVQKNQELILCGSSSSLGAWQADGVLKLIARGKNRWQIQINNEQIKSATEYKLAIIDSKTRAIVHWEEGENRTLIPRESTKNVIYIESLSYRYGWMNWKAAGVSIPVFSLRSEKSFGIGEFSDLKLLIDWAVSMGQKVIQILPINDTTVTHSWTDSYPYNAISIYALHPIYLGLGDYPLADNNLNKKYRKEAAKLNLLPDVDYEQVLTLKWNYIKSLYKEIGTAVLACDDYKTFYNNNEKWLFPYACFSFLRDRYKTSQYTEWNEYCNYNKEQLERLIENDESGQHNVNLSCFTQYLLHKQLIEAKEYAHKNSVILKGDIPIGISKNSVEAWTEPHLFNLDTQTGAPPDDFSINGQNWGFPTYNWDEMSKDNYEWWTRRFRKMADYFDAYRIDHILGFFRIWEIPESSVQGLLGYFSPALPLSIEEIESAGFNFDEQQMTQPYIHKDYLAELFGKYSSEVINNYLHPKPDSGILFALKEEYNTQRKIKELLGTATSNKSVVVREGLYHLCNEVLFIRDKQQPNKFHPRITAQQTNAYNALNENSKEAFNRIYDNFFYHRHSNFWHDQAMKKLPTLISSTSMLVCGEDLGMIPECVPDVMKELQILSLEIERMPKEAFQLFGNLKKLPYLSVCSTSTHDMSPIRAWWTENRNISQQYYNYILGKEGEAPKECTPEICELIINNHLNSPAMLAIIPFQDWVAIDKNLRCKDPQKERINEPSNPHHYWKYRMHITLEKLLESRTFNNKIKSLLDSSDRI